MFKFFQSKFGTVKATPETQRQTFERALGEINTLVALMADKPKITIDPTAGSVSYELPDQMPDEALALPAPVEKEAVAETTEEVAEEASEDAAEEIPAVEDAKKEEAA